MTQLWWILLCWKTSFRRTLFSTIALPQSNIICNISDSQRGAATVLGADQYVDDLLGRMWFGGKVRSKIALDVSSPSDSAAVSNWEEVGVSLQKR